MRFCLKPVAHKGRDWGCRRGPMLKYSKWKMCSLYNFLDKKNNSFAPKIKSSSESVEAEVAYILLHALSKEQFVGLRHSEMAFSPPYPCSLTAGAVPLSSHQCWSTNFTTILTAPTHSLATPPPVFVLFLNSSVKGLKGKREHWT